MANLTKNENVTLELLNDFVNEINRDWTPNYKSELISDSELVVRIETYNEDNESIFKEIAGIKNGLVWGDDEDAFEQLVYMLER